MNNSLARVKKEMKHFLKKNKTLKYSLGLVLTFLMAGELSTADSDLDNLSKTAKDIEKSITESRKKNKKKLRIDKMELIKLEEEGDHVVKSPWYSAQFDIGYDYHTYSSKKKNTDYVDSQGNSSAYGWILGKDGKLQNVLSAMGVGDNSYVKLKGIGIAGGSDYGASASYGGVQVIIPGQPKVTISVDGGVRPKPFPVKPKAPVINVALNPVLPELTISGGADGMDIPSIGEILVNEPTVNPLVNVNPVNVSVSVNAPTVNIPQVMAVNINITPPNITAPGLPPDVSVDASAKTTATGDDAWFWYTGGDLGPINQINLETGTFNVIFKATLAAGQIQGTISNYTGTIATTGAGTNAYGLTSSTNINTSTSFNISASSTVGFYKWVGAPVVRMSDGVAINITGEATANANSRALFKNDIHGNQRKTLAQLENTTYNTTRLNANGTTTPVTGVTKLTTAEANFIRSLDIFNTRWKTASGATLMYAENNANWNLSGTYLNGYEADGHNTGSYATIFHNDDLGIITATKDSSNIALTAFGPEGGSNRDSTVVNTGTMVLNGSSATAGLFMRTGTADDLNFLNYGEIIINGSRNAGIIAKGSRNAASSIYLGAPIKIFGDKNVGVDIKTAGLEEATSEFRVNMGVNGAVVNGTNPSATIASGNDGDTRVSENVGILSAANVSVKDYKVEIGTETSKNIGARSTGGTLTLKKATDGIITIHGGTGNMALVSAGTTGIINAQGDISILAGIGNMAAFASNAGANITVGGKITAGTTGTLQDSVLIYTTNSGQVTVTGDITAKLGKSIGGSSVAYAGKTATAGTITLNGKLTIDADGMGLYADGGTLTATNGTGNNIIVDSVGSAGIAANNSGTLSYKGDIAVTNGVAIYSKGNGTATFVLGGTANISGAGHGIYLESGGNVVNNGTINVTGATNAAIIVGAGGDTTKITGGGTINVGNSSDAGGVGVFVQGISGTPSTFAFPTATINFIGENITAFAVGDYVNPIINNYTNITLTGSTTQPNVLLAIAGAADPAQNISTSGTITNTMNNVVALAVTSGTNLSATARTVTNTGTITASNGTNTGSTAVYIANANQFINNGTVVIGGNGTNIGMIAANNSIFDAGTGSIDLKGSGTGVILSGNSSIIGTNLNLTNTAATTTGIGVYIDKVGAYTNNINITEAAAGTGSLVLLTGKASMLENTGALTVAKAGSVGMYTGSGLSGTISNTGVLNVTDGIGMMINTTGGKTVGSFGTINLNSSATTGVGVVVEGDGVLTLPANLAVSNVGGNNVVALHLKDVTTDAPTLRITNAGANGKIIGLTGNNAVRTTAGTEIDLTTGVGNIGIYQGSTGPTLTAINQGTIKVGTQGLGMFGDASNVTNTGIIEATNAGATSNDFSIGLYTKTANTITNTGTIRVTNDDSGLAGSSSIGMYAESPGSVIDNTGIIELNKQNSIALFAKDGAVIKNIGTIRDGASNVNGGGIGIYLSNSLLDPSINNIDLTGVTGRVGVFVSDDTSQSIRNWGGTITVGDSTATNKAVAMYYNVANPLPAAVGSPFVINANLNTGKDGVGLYLMGKTATALTPTIKDYASYNGTINVGNGGTTGIGIYLKNVKLNLDNGTININETGGTAFYVGANSELEIPGGGANITINYNADGSIAVVEGGVFNFSASDFNVNTNGYKVSLGTAMRGIVNVSGHSTIGGTKGFSSSQGVINVASGSIIDSIDTGAIALYAQKHQLLGTLVGSGGLAESNNVEIYNNGNISLWGSKSAGIVLEDARALNNGSITVGADSYGIYAREAILGTSSIVNNGAITLGANSIGIFQYVDGASYGSIAGNIVNSGNITSIANDAKGIYVLSNAVNTNSGTINLTGDNSIGIWAKDGGAMTNTGTLILGNGGTALYALGKNSVLVSSTITSTAPITVGQNGTVAYAKDGGVINVGGNITTSGGLFFANGTGSQVNYTGGTITVNPGAVSKNFVVAANGGVVNLGTINLTDLTVSDNGVGFYSDPTSSVMGSAVVGTLNVGRNAIGIAGNIGVTVTNINLAGDGSKGIFQDSGAITTFSSIINSAGVGSDRIGYVIQSGGPTITLGGNVNISGDGERNIGFYTNSADTLSINAGTEIKMGNANSSENANVGVYFAGVNPSTLTGSGSISVGNNSLGVMSDAQLTLNSGTNFVLGENAGGAYSKHSIMVNGFTGTGISTNVNDMSYGVYAPVVTVNGNMNLNGLKYGVVAEENVVVSGGQTINGNSMKDNSVMVLSGGDNVPVGAVITNAGTITVDSDTAKSVTLIQGKNIDIINATSGILNAGDGGIAIYGESSGKPIRIDNAGIINIGKSIDKGIGSNIDIDYSVGIGLVAPEYRDLNGIIIVSTAHNTGAINVKGDRGIGIYAIGASAAVYNGTPTGGITSGTIILDPDFTNGLSRDGDIKTMTGMYLNDHSTGYNYGTIKTNGYIDPSKVETGIIGVVAYNESKFYNHGLIDIDAGNKGIGVLISGGAVVTNYGTIKVTGGVGIQNTPDNPGIIAYEGTLSAHVEKKYAGILVNHGTLSLSGNTVVKNLLIRNYGTLSVDPEVQFDNGIAQLVSTSGIKENMALGDMKQIFKDQIGTFDTAQTLDIDTLLDTELVKDAANRGKTTLNVTDLTTAIRGAYKDANPGNKITAQIYADSLTWSYIPKDQSGDNQEYFQKRNYGDLFVDSNLAVFGYSLDELYINPNDKEFELFNHISTIDNAGVGDFGRTMQEMMGNEYADVQTRMKLIDKTYDRALKQLDETENTSKNAGKFKIIAEKGEYENKELRAHDYDYVTTGVLYMEDFEKVTKREGKSGYYLGFVYNNIDFEKGKLKSEENSGVFKIGYHQKMGVFNNRRDLNWGMNVGATAGYHRMDREFTVYNNGVETDIYKNKANYFTYGISLDNKLSKTIKLGRNFAVIPAVGLSMEYGRFTDIKEKDNAVALKIKGNDYYEITPNVSIDVKTGFNLSPNYKLNFVIGAEAGYNLGDTKYNNLAMVKRTSAGTYSLEELKMDREYAEATARIEIENQVGKFGIYGGYSTDKKERTIGTSITIKF